MNKTDFLNLIISKCNIDEDITENTLLEDCEDWDSLAIITTLSLFKANFGKAPNVEKMQNCKTFKDILDLTDEK